MHREPLLTLLARYRDVHAGDAAEIAVVNRVEALVREHTDCLLRTCLPGHITASAWIVSHDRQQFLLTHHKKLNRWLQLGGHVDGEVDVQNAALREAREESGLDAFQLFQAGGALVPLDVDIHGIPAHKSEPAHDHHDIRFLLIAPRDAEVVVSEESHALRWFPRTELASVVTEPSMLRMAAKAAALLGA